MQKGLSGLLSAKADRIPVVCFRRSVEIPVPVPVSSFSLCYLRNLKNFKNLKNDEGLKSVSHQS